MTMQWLVVMFSLLVSGFAQAQITELDCDFKITAVPITITSPGTWCFDKDLTYSGSGNGPIDIKASNVTLDLNSHILRGPMDGGKVVTNSAYLTGVNVSGVCCTTDPTLQYNNIKIRNGTISGFHYGITIQGNIHGSGHIIENMQIRDTASSAISFNTVKNAIVRNTTISRLDASLCGITSGCGNPAAVYGISASSSNGVKIENNTITGMKGVNGISMGIYFVSTTNSIIEGNVVESVSPSNVSDIGIQVNSSPLVVNNRLIKVKTGISMDAGTYYVRNITTGTITPYVGGTPKGTENY